MVTILLVDDEGPLRQQLALLIRVRMSALDEEVEVHTAGNGIEGLQVFRRNPLVYALVISDLEMPHNNGLEMLKEIRAIRSDVPTLLLSATLPKAKVIQSSGVVDRVLDKAELVILGKILKEMLKL